MSPRPLTGAPTFPDWTSYDGASPRGRDFLGLQSVGDAMLDVLLPGMTNATRHPRYYAFFCWLFKKAHDRRLSVKQTDELRFRYETALVYAAKATHPRDFSGVVGIRSVERGDTVWKGPERRYPLTKEQWGDRASAFSPPVYSPSFTRLGLIDRDPGGAIALLPLGQQLAEAFERGLTAPDALEALSTRKTAEGHVLEHLHDDLCPCAVRTGARPERAPLIDLLFKVQDTRMSLVSEADRARRRSLAYLLDLVAAAEGEFPKTDDDLRTLLYFGRFPSGRRYSPPPALRATAEAWRLFQARQYQRYAIEALWVAYLQLIARSGSVPFTTRVLVRELGDALDRDGHIAGGRKASTRFEDLTLAAFESRIRRRWSRSGPDTWSATDPADTLAEPQWKYRIDESIQDDPALLLTNALGLLGVLWVRWRAVDDPSARAFLAAGGRARISVASMVSEFDSRGDLQMSALLAWVLEEYTVAQHMRVATNKLRTEGLDTFWFLAQEHGYMLHPEREVAKARPGYNAPKIWAALSALYDLRLVMRNRESVYTRSSDGDRMVQRVLEVESDA